MPLVGAVLANFCEDRSGQAKGHQQGPPSLIRKGLVLAVLAHDANYDPDGYEGSQQNHSGPNKDSHRHFGHNFAKLTYMFDLGQLRRVSYRYSLIRMLISERA